MITHFLFLEGLWKSYKWDFVVLNQQLADIINALFAVLAILGVVTDPTTASISDSKQALTYEEPKKEDVD